jgi:putative FmdB family regulatory protein
MPWYDYECEACGRIATDVRVLRFNHPMQCDCGDLMVKQPAAPAFALKGSGFYANDSKVSAPRPQPHQTKEGVHMQPVSAERAFRK